MTYLDRIGARFNKIGTSWWWDYITGASGVGFCRDPSTGKNEFYGEFLVNAQGEDVVAGIRTPQELTIRARQSHGSDLPSLEEVMPNIFRELLSVRSQLETHYKDMQDIEFTIQSRCRHKPG